MVDVLSKPVNSKVLDKLVKKYHKSTSSPAEEKSISDDDYD